MVRRLSLLILLAAAAVGSRVFLLSPAASAASPAQARGVNARLRSASALPYSAAATPIFGNWYRLWDYSDVASAQAALADAADIVEPNYLDHALTAMNSRVGESVEVETPEIVADAVVKAILDAKLVDETDIERVKG